MCLASPTRGADWANYQKTGISRNPLTISLSAHNVSDVVGGSVGKSRADNTCLPIVIVCLFISTIFVSVCELNRLGGTYWK